MIDVDLTALNDYFSKMHMSRPSKKNYLLLVFIFILNTVHGQGILTVAGTIKDEKNIVLPGATVFLTGTKSITATDENGNFKLLGISPGNYDLVIKMIGYSPVIKTVTLSTDISGLNFSLKPSNLLLKEITIHPDFNREKYISIFKREFLGRSINARACVLTNPEVLYVNFDKRKKLLKVSAEEFLIVQNRALGYQIKYLLNNFEFDEQTSIVHYEGYPSFENSKGNQKQEDAWKRNQKTAYAGSINHFFKSIYNDNYAAQGFDTYKVIGKPMPGEHPKYQKPVIFEEDPVSFDSLLTVKNKNFKSIKFTDCLYVVYKNEKESQDFVDLGYSIKRPATKKPISDGQVSLVYLIADSILIDKNGSFSPTQGLIFEGYWAWEKVADLMPLEYEIENK